MNEKILIVDDDAEIAQLVSVYLKNEGFQTTVEYSGTEALKLIRDHKFDPGGPRRHASRLQRISSL